ncbi:hypothetical protein [Crenobacter intestini]|uniref:DUF4145 domain-containing protein n=1 Tax=Crenobacter intestini TaxID=2563443 RepID=A0A4T0V7I5_9NEIS|nr:hypothetical protein [Crenobacter intestini]TIC87255.1 hypothetical protein E5K04_02215 [Crenobacter intestini]
MSEQPTATMEDLLKALEESDDERRAARAERNVWLSLHKPSVSVFMGRTESLQVLREAREVFVDGHFVASLLMAVSFIEHTLVEELQLLGHTKGSPTLGQAIAIAQDKKVFPADWLERAKTLSLRRNPFAHLKEGWHQHALATRVRDERRHPVSIMESDAKDAIDLMYNFFVATLRPMPN